MVLYGIFTGISKCIQIIEIIIAAYCLCSWILPPTNRLYEVLRNIAWPFIAPFRSLSMKLMMRTGLRLDLSALMALLALQVLSNLLWRLYVLIVY